MELIAITLLSLTAMSPNESVEFDLIDVLRAGSNELGDLGDHLWARGDLDGDGFGDFLCLSGGVQLNDDISVVWAVSGREKTILGQWVGPPDNSLFGRYSMWGDVNGDGVEDVLVSDDTSSIAVEGAVVVYNGHSLKPLSVLRGEKPGDLFGTGLDLIHDIDSDGWRDVLVGARSHDSGGLLNSGAAYIVSSRTSEILWRWEGRRRAELLPDALANVGDLDFDGIDDFAIGSAAADVGPHHRAGRLWVFSGATRDVLYEFAGDRDGQFLGASIVPIGDADLDGACDFLSREVGKHYLFSGKTGSVGYELQDGIDIIIAQPGRDYDRDGVTDILSPWILPKTVRVLSGANGRPLAEFGTIEEWPASPITGVDDLTGDGLPDVLVSRPTDEHGGSVFVYGQKSLRRVGNSELHLHPDPTILTIDAPALGNKVAWLLLAHSRKNGSTLLDRKIPLDDDPLLRWTLAHPTTISLNAEGKGSIRAPSNIGPILENREVWAAFATFDDVERGRLRAVSNAERIWP